MSDGGERLPWRERLEQGCGLLIVEALADRWGIAAGTAPRKTVRAELDLVR